MRILYDSKNLKYKSPFGCLCQEEVCHINIDIPTSCETYGVSLEMCNEHSGETLSIDMEPKKTDGIYDTFGCSFMLEKPGLYFYSFFVKTKGSDFALYKEGFSDTNIGDGEKWQLSCYAKDFTVPQSFQGKVMYQIFPDRFHKSGTCDTSQKLLPYWVHEDKNDIPVFEPDENGKVTNCDFYGGNLKGIEEKLRYIKELGVSVIYLNPIFKAYSNHRYDTCDYKKIDPMLGTEEDFINLCSSAHKLGIKIILDGVFSHTGSNSIYFDKEHIFGNGAVSSENSPYKSWYNFSEFPHSYDAWWGIETLPAVNEMDKSYLDYIINDEDSVIAHWLKLGADGYRLDVADELPDEFIYLLRKKVKEVKPDSYVVGEVWEDASNKISYSKRRKYFVGSELDSVMNYVFKNAIIDLVCENITAEDFSNTIMTVAENYPPMCFNSLMNSLSTHDTARILTCLSGCSFPETKSEQAKVHLNSKQKSTAVTRLFLAGFLQYILPGMPCIYYGDEIGMEGFGDPFCRAYFKWDDMNKDILHIFKELGKIKNSVPALQYGDISIQTEGNVLKICRKCKDSAFEAVINMGDEPVAENKKTVLISHLTGTVGEKLYINKGGFAAFMQ